MRYIVNDAYWSGGDKPIFFYTGNEGDIVWFCENSVIKKCQIIQVFK